MKNFIRFLIKTAAVFLSVTFLILFTYFLILPPKVISITPADDSGNNSLDSALIVKFNKPIKRQEIRTSISPEAYGEWKFQNPLMRKNLFRELVFVPAIDLEPGTQYLVKIENIKGFGFAKSTSFQFSFKTKEKPQEQAVVSGQEEVNQPKIGSVPGEPSQEKPEVLILETAQAKAKTEVTMLDIPMDWQDSFLSCEAASLKMALSFKKVNISEKQIMEKIGYDPTPHKGNIWGDPYQAFVGYIDGLMCNTGYGVYWEAVAKSANNWAKAESFSNWKITDLVEEIKQGNPVVVWGTLQVATPTDCSWFTTSGKYIKALKETHVRLVIGFIGSAENPSKIILNDPLSGRLFWTTNYFLKNWKSFDYSGVVIR